MTPEEEAAAKTAKEKADKEAADKAAAEKAAKEASEASEAASKKEKEYWTNAHNELKMRVEAIEEDGAPRPWLSIVALLLGGFSALIILLAFVASFVRQQKPQG